MRKIINRYSDDVDAFDSNALADRIAERRRAEVGEKMLNYYQDRPGMAESDLKSSPLKNLGMESEAVMSDDRTKGSAMKRAKRALDRIKKKGY
jgi:hypothetical protein